MLHGNIIISGWIHVDNGSKCVVASDVNFLGEISSAPLSLVRMRCGVSNGFEGCVAECR